MKTHLAVESMQLCRHFATNLNCSPYGQTAQWITIVAWLHPMETINFCSKLDGKYFSIGQCQLLVILSQSLVILLKRECSFR